MTDWYPYRIKTEEEFLHEYGSDWRSAVQFNCEGDMDFMCGKQLPFSENEIKDVLSNNWRYLRFEGWVIKCRMITKNKKTIPDYTPKITIRTIDEDYE